MASDSMDLLDRPATERPDKGALVGDLCGGGGQGETAAAVEVEVAAAVDVSLSVPRRMVPSGTGSS